MRKASFVTLALTVALLVPVATMGIPLTTNDGIWQNPNPAETADPTDFFPEIDNSGDPRVIRWGDPVPVEPDGGGDPNDQQSGYTYSPLPTDINAPSDGTPFKVGDFVHENFPINAPLLEDVELSVTFAVDGGTPFGTEILFEHNETPNFPASGICPSTGLPPPPNGCNDIISAAPASLSIPFLFGGNAFLFQLLGFSDGLGGFVFEGRTREFDTTPGELFARIVPAPEPTTVLLLGTGLLGLGYFSRRWRPKA